MSVKLKLGCFYSDNCAYTWCIVGTYSNSQPLLYIGVRVCKDRVVKYVGCSDGFPLEKAAMCRFLADGTGLISPKRGWDTVVLEEQVFPDDPNGPAALEELAAQADEEG